MSGMESCSSVMKLCTSALTVPLLLIIITGSESGHPVVKVEFKGTAFLPCTVRCSGEVRWFRERSDILAECDQTSCRSVKEGYQMIYNQYLKGDLSLIIRKADYSKTGWYTCDCDGTDLCDVELQIEDVQQSQIWKEGYKDGYSAGHEDGYSAGYQKGLGVGGGSFGIIALAFGVILGVFVVPRVLRLIRTREQAEQPDDMGAADALSLDSPT